MSELLLNTEARMLRQLLKHLVILMVTSAMLCVFAVNTLAEFRSSHKHESLASAESKTIRDMDLPSEAQHTLALIKKGGPFPYSKDGTLLVIEKGSCPQGPGDTIRNIRSKLPEVATGERGV